MEKYSRGLKTQGRLLVLTKNPDIRTNGTIRTGTRLIATSKLGIRTESNIP